MKKVIKKSTLLSARIQFLKSLDAKKRGLGALALSKTRLDEAFGFEVAIDAASDGAVKADFAALGARESQVFVGGASDFERAVSIGLSEVEEAAR